MIFLRKIVESLKYDFTILKSNQSFFCYLASIFFLLIFSIGWGFFALHNLALLLLGLCLSVFGLSTVIKIDYPQSLETVIASKGWITAFQKNKKTLLFLLIIFLVSSVFCLNLFTLVQWIVEWIIDNYQVLILLQNNPQIFVLVGLFSFLLLFPVGLFFLPKLGFVLKQRFSTFYWNRTNKKVFLFFRLYPKAKKNIFISFLTILTLFIGTVPLFFPFVLWSLHTNNGIIAYFFYLLCVVCGLVVTLPSFRRYFFGLYSPNSLRIIGWNSPQQRAGAAALGVVTLGAAYLLKDSAREIVEGAVDRENRRRDDLMEENRQNRYNQRVDKIHQKDPEGAIKGKYPYAPMDYEKRDFRKPKWVSQEPSGSTDTSSSNKSKK